MLLYQNINILLFDEVEVDEREIVIMELDDEVEVEKCLLEQVYEVFEIVSQ